MADIFRHIQPGTNKNEEIVIRVEDIWAIGKYLDKINDCFAISVFGKGDGIVYLHYENQANRDTAFETLTKSIQDS